MDPVSALGLAATVLKLVTASAKIASVLQEGSPERNAELASDVKNLKLWLDEVKNSPPHPDETSELNDFAGEASKIADQLLGDLSKAAAQPNSKLLDKSLASFNARWNSRGIKSKAERLNEMRNTLQLGIILKLEQKVNGADILSNTVFQSLNDQTKTAVIEALEQVSSARAEWPNSMGNETLSEGNVLKTIISRLNFLTREDRRDHIDAKHAKTFEWIYRSPADRVVPWESFVDWLNIPGGTYWISGRAGSGKSTLMKFLNEKEKEKEKEKQRKAKAEASSEPIGQDSSTLILSFYFWNSGTYLAKSQKGLFKSLLLQALEQDSSLGPILFPDQYNRYLNWEAFPTFDQLNYAFDQLTKQKLHKILFIIDGLDEFEPGPINLIKLATLFTTAAGSSNVKAILSSRPLLEVEEPLGPAQLQLHDLTRDDITAYVDDELKKKPRMVELFESNQRDADSLVEEIVDSANGVFLWVKLVIDSLLVGLRAYDSIDDLKGRLRKLDKNLEKLFEQMLGKIKVEYQASWSRTVQLIQLGKDAGSISPTALTLSFANLSHEEILAAEIKPRTHQEEESEVRRIRAHLKEHTAGLIEVTKAQTAASFALGTHPNERVDYVHRTVADFLKTDWVRFIGPKGDRGQEVVRTLLDCILMQIKTHRFGSADTSDEEEMENFDSLWELIEDAMQIAKHSRCVAEDTFDELERVMDHHFRRIPDNLKGPVNWKSWWDTVTRWSDSEERWRKETDSHKEVACYDNFFSTAVRYGLTDYVLAKIKTHGKRVSRKEGRPVLDYACYLYPHWAAFVGQFEPTIVEALLQNGANPNEEFNSRTPWIGALDIHESSDFVRPDDYEERLLVFKLLIKHGADPNARIRHAALRWTTQRSALFQLLDMFYVQSDTRYKALEAEIIRLLKRKGAKAKQWKLVETGYRRRYPPRAEVPFLDETDLSPSWRKRLSARVRSQPEPTWIMGTRGKG
ncbi:hypothetical protein N431DRAFT_474246 [Stipitochalara longipes BDJ]|nr:hypothetical protein N431DRAFT_474246 [Stipitochalara longipes BDJ]